MNLDIGFSPCPNDTYTFHALTQGEIDTGPYLFTSRIADVEELNRRAFDRTHAVTKLSFAAYLSLKDRYALLDAGSALGYGCGPLLVAGRPVTDFEKARIAVPGRYTTAFLLLRLWLDSVSDVEFVRFDEILPGIASGRFDAGVIIHEGRFVYPSYDCIRIIDLGEWWESETRLPIPLGCIAIRNDLLPHKEAVEGLIRDSLTHARMNPGAPREFIRLHAQELDDRVIAEHIALYVNDFSLSLGDTGMQAIRTLEELARCRNIL
jgi:1,4-dihydroxy-6-naphthoate synthase